MRRCQKTFACADLDESKKIRFDFTREGPTTISDKQTEGLETASEFSSQLNQYL